MSRESETVDRETIPKTKIKEIGGFNSDGAPDKDWVFDGRDIPNSIGHYCVDGVCVLYGGYTVEELREIKENAPADHKEDK